jgi:hypothetical protein
MSGCSFGCDLSQCLYCNAIALLGQGRLADPGSAGESVGGCFAVRGLRSEAWGVHVVLALLSRFGWGGRSIGWSKVWMRVENLVADVPLRFFLWGSGLLSGERGLCFGRFWGRRIGWLLLRRRRSRFSGG